MPFVSIAQKELAKSYRGVMVMGEGRAPLFTFHWPAWSNYGFLDGTLRNSTVLVCLVPKAQCKSNVARLRIYRIGP